MPAVLIIDEMHPSILPGLEALGFEVYYAPELRRAEILAILHEYTGLIVRSKTKIDAEFLAHAPQLQFIGRAGSGLDLFDLAEIAAHKVFICNAPEGNRDAVAEHTLGMLLSLIRKIPQSNQQVRAMQWLREENRGEEIKGKVVSIIGYGNIGKEVAKRLRGFDCTILANDRTEKGFSNDYVREASLEEIFEHTDILTLHIPLNEHNFHIVNKNYLANFRKPIILLNSSRGEVVDLPDLVEALASGKVRGVCLDVLENENLHALTPAQRQTLDALQQYEQVLFSPHVAGWTHESYRRINEVLLDKIQKFLQLQTL